MMMVSLSAVVTVISDFVADAGDQGLQGCLVAKGRFQQVNQLNPEVKDINTLGPQSVPGTAVAAASGWQK
jgi:hypothetical protein